MLYALAVFLPPLAFLGMGKYGQFFINIFLLCCGIIPGLIHALMVVHAFETKKSVVGAIREAKAA